MIFLFKRWSENKGAILGDDMGMGKSLQVIAFMATVLSMEKSAKFLIIAPLTTLEQWESEARKWAGLRCSTYHGGRSQKKAALANLLSARVTCLLTSYDTFEREGEDAFNLDWSAVVLDELHRLKSHKTKVYQACVMMDCKRRIGLTGTLMQNNLKELYTVVNFIQPSVLGTPMSFESAYIRPIKSGLRRDAIGLEVAQAKQASKNLANKLKDVYLRRDKSLIAGSRSSLSCLVWSEFNFLFFFSLADSLPSKEDNIMFCAMTDLQTEVYKKVLALPDYELLKSSAEVCDKHQTVRRQCCLADRTSELQALMLKAISNLRKICNHLYRVVESDDKAFCRQALGEELEEKVKRMHLEFDDELSGKLRVLAQLLPEWKKEESKVLLFSQSTKMLDILARFLSHNNYQVCFFFSSCIRFLRFLPQSIADWTALCHLTNDIPSSINFPRLHPSSSFSSPPRLAEQVSISPLQTSSCCVIQVSAFVCVFSFVFFIVWRQIGMAPMICKPVTELIALDRQKTSKFSGLFLPAPSKSSCIRDKYTNSSWEMWPCTSPTKSDFLKRKIFLECPISCFRATKFSPAISSKRQTSNIRSLLIL